MSDDEFLTAFERCTLPGMAWTHEAHVRTAWLYLARGHEAAALAKIRSGIQRFNATVLKKETGYHETITVAYTRLIADRRITLRTGHTFAEFKEVSGDLLDRTLTAVLRHYSRELLFSDGARHGWIAPDLEALPATP